MASSCRSQFSLPPPLASSVTAATADEDLDSSSSLSTVHPDILRTHILTRLDGPTLASVACASSELNSLSSSEDLWASLCRSTWPSTDTPRLHQVISSFPDGPRSFFSDAFPLLSNIDLTTATKAPTQPQDHHRPSGLISAADIYYRGELIFRKFVETETVSGWFRCSPFRIDMLDPKDTCPTPIPHPETEDTCRDLAEDLTLSWILIDEAGRRAMNLSSHKPVSVHRHWLSGEVHARFAAVLAGDKRSSSSSTEYVQCGIVVTCGGGAHGDGMRVREVSLQIEDMDGMFLNGKDSLGILQRTFGARKGVGMRRREAEGRKRFEEFLEMRRVRKERRLRTESTLDMLCVTFGVLVFASFGFFVLLR